MILEQIKEKIQRAKGARDQIQKTLSDMKERLKYLEKRKEYIEKAQVLIQTTAKETQEKLRYHIEDIVNMALDICFPNKYSFIVDFQIKRGKTEAELFLVKDRERIDPLAAAGGGVADIVSFALRLSAWSLSKTDNVIILDEPFKFLSSNLRPLAGEVLKQLSEKLNLQIIMVTHDEVMIDIADKVFEVKQKKGVSEVYER